MDSKDYPFRLVRRMAEGMNLSQEQFDAALARLKTTGEPQKAMDEIAKVIEAPMIFEKFVKRRSDEDKRRT